MKTRHLYCGLLMAAVAFLSCKKDKDKPSPGKGKDLVLTAEEQRQVEADNKFNFKLFRNLAANAGANENIVFSPLSISMALSMTTNGANGATLEEMRTVLEQKDFSEDQVNSYYKKLNNELPALDPLADLRLANSIWYRQGFTPLAPFLAANQDNYKATVEALDFGNPAAKDKINNWVDKNTNGKIPGIIEQIDSDLLMYLINAVYFKSDWKYPFEKNKTQKEAFYTNGSTSIQTDFMQGRVNLNIGQANGVTAYELPYGNEKYSMLILLPEEGSSVTEVINTTDAITWDALMKSLHPAMAELHLPKFKFAYKSDLLKRLLDLGMTLPFSTSADFSRISTGGNIRISEVTHKAFIEVNETGTEAAAVTVVGTILTTVSPVVYPTLTIDRPFIFVIREMKTGLVLFNGVVKNPLQAQ